MKRKYTFILRSFLCAFFLVTSIIIFTSKTSALTIDPSSGNYAPNSTLNINLKANPQGEENGIAIRLEASGMVIKLCVCYPSQDREYYG
jgi:hypothetical protein